MSFSSLIFISAFLPIFLLLNLIFRDTKRRNIILLLFSILFYIFSGPIYLLLLILETVCIAHLSRNISKIKLYVGVILILAILCFFKYFNFALPYLEDKFLLDIQTVALPLGISFYSFKLISYIVDVYKKRVESKSYLELLIYTLMFAQVSQGPISRFTEIESDLRDRKIDFYDMSEGMFRFFTGLAKKTILADYCGVLATQILPVNFLETGSSISIVQAYTAGLLYMLQIYLDFSAYSDMAIGLGLICGFHFSENFNFPYIATSIRDFWRRWHISLSLFFRDYVYIPLGGNRKTMLRTILNSLVVWLLTGIWHGSQFNFVLWGLYFFIFITIENIFRKWRDKHSNVVIPRILKHIYTLIVVYFSWVLFRFTDIHSLSHIFSIMFGLRPSAFVDSVTLLSIKNNIFIIIIAILICTPIYSYIVAYLRQSMLRAGEIRRKASIKASVETVDIPQEDTEIMEIIRKYDEDDEIHDSKPVERKYIDIRSKIEKQNEYLLRGEKIYYIFQCTISILMLILSLMAMVGSSYVPFLYNQF